jgi:hypothetical protein
MNRENRSRNIRETEENDNLLGSATSPGNQYQHVTYKDSHYIPYERNQLLGKKYHSGLTNFRVSYFFQLDSSKIDVL